MTNFEKITVATVIWEKQTQNVLFFFKNVLIVTCFQATVTDGSRTWVLKSPLRVETIDNSEQLPIRSNYEVGFINTSI